MPAPESRWRSPAWRLALLLLLAVTIFLLGSINLPFLEPDDPPEVILLYVFSGAVFLAFVVFALILIRYLLRLYAERQAPGGKFKTKMVAAALGLSLLPVLALFFLSYALVNRTLDKWFPRPLEIVRDDARYIAARMKAEHEDRVRALAQDVAERDGLAPALARRDRVALERLLTHTCGRHGIDWAAVFDATDAMLASCRRTTAPADFEPLARRLLEPRDALAFTTVLAHAGRQYTLARVRVEDARERALGAVVLAEPLGRELLARAARIESESEAYEAIRRERKTYRGQAILILLLITVLLLLAATWSALHLARQVTVPIQALAEATGEVSRGHFNHRVEVAARDELRTLVDSFNQMTADLGQGRQRLETALGELDRRRQWMEAILESIPAGVITLGRDLRVLSVNHAVEELFGRRHESGQALNALAGQETTRSLVELSARAGRSGSTSASLEIRLAQRTAQVAVTVSALRSAAGAPAAGEGFVVVLDDLTELFQAQKAAAWQEVAQRMAHEIKNPLTPIQLSADRIRNYVERQPGSNPAEQQRFRELVGDCARLIGQEVHSLKALVDEFSRFARFPVAKPVPTRLNALVESALALYRESANGARLVAELGADLPDISADPDLLRRVIVNLLDNAAQAVASAPQREIRVTTRFLGARRAVELTVADSGAGIAAEHKDKLFLPFFSTRADGTGLGLAIASRIVAEHGGSIRAENNQPTGARFIVELPAGPARA